MVSIQKLLRSESNDEFKIAVTVNNENRDKVIADIIYQTFLLHMKYIQVFENRDAIFDYTEMSNVGVMATASWNLGWPAMIEYQAEKFSGKAHQHNDTESYKWGRADLYLCNADHEFICEAKLAFSHNGNLDNKNVLSRIVGAYEDTKNSITRYYDSREDEKKNGHHEGYAITFISHRCTISKKQKKFEEKVKDFLATLVEGKFDGPSYLKRDEKDALSLDGVGHLFLETSIKEEDQYELYGLSILYKRVGIA